MEKDLISVIVPIYNRENTLNKCINSILSQTYSNFELILVNDGSTDSSAQICESFAQKDKRVKVVHQENKGVSAARNKGLSECMGGYVAFVDSDDYIASDYLEYLYKLIMDTDSDMSVCTHQYVTLDGKGEQNFDEGIDFVLNPEQFFDKMFYGELKGIGISIHSRLIRKDLFDGVVFPEGKLFEDSAVSYLNIINSHRIAITYKPKYCYVRHKDSIVQKKFDESRLDFIEAEEKMVGAVMEAYPNLKGASRRRIIYVYLNTLAYMVLAHDPKYRSLEIKLKNQIMPYCWKILNDKRVPKKDKYSMLILRLGGIPMYRIAYFLFKRNQL